MHSIKVSIIIPTYNSSKTLHACLKSIADQIYKKIEVLIIDGMSTDETIEIARSYTHSIPALNIVSESDKGVYDAMNKGILMAQGEWLYFLGSDDLLFNDNTLKLIFDCKRDDVEQADIVYGNVVFKESNIHSSYHENFNILNFFNTNICHQSMFYRRAVFDKMGLYSLKYPVFSDWEFNTRCFFNDSLRIKYMSDIVAYYSMEGLSNHSTDRYQSDKAQLIQTLLQEKHLYYKLNYINIKNKKETAHKRIYYRIIKLIIFLLENINSDLQVVRR